MIHTFFQNLIHNIRLQTKKKVRWYVVVPTVLIIMSISVFGFAFGDTAHASWFEDTIAGALNGLVIIIAQIIFFLATLAISLTVFALKFFIHLAGYNGYSTAPIVELGWTLVRDIANMFFIVALLVIAFATILGREDYAIKKTLGKLILMAILINFSKLISQVIIDAAHVVTMTFLNALSAVAGGNLIRMFKFDSMRSLLTAGISTDESTNSLSLQLLGASVLTLLMTLTALLMLGVYFIVMLYRVVMLWVLIIFSPIAYAAAALPATANISSEWWSNFTKNVISAPMMVFFMWLAFATIGNGAVLSQINENNSLPGGETAAFEESSVYDSQRNTSGQNQADFAPTVSEATTWSNMAGFAVAIAFLYAGIEQVQKLGVRGTDNLTTAKDWGRKAALFGSGALVAGWAGKKAFERTKQTAYLTGVGLDAAARRSRFGGAYRSIADSNDRWEGAVDQAKSVMADRKKSAQIVGGAGWMSPSDKTVAEATLEREATDRTYNKGTEKAVSDFKREKITSEQTEFDDLFNTELTAAQTRNGGRPLTEREQETLRGQLLANHAARFAVLASYSTDAQAKTAAGKLTGTEDRTVAGLRDMDRVISGGAKKFLRAQFEKDRKDDMEDAARMDADERADAIVEIGTQIRRLRRTGANPEELRLAQGKIDGFLQSALENGEGESLKSHLAAIAERFRDTTDAAAWRNTAEDEAGTAQILLALQTGDTQAAISTDFQGADQRLRQNAGAMANVRMRNMALAAKKQAEKTGAVQWTGVTLKGINQFGQETWGYANAMNAGLPPTGSPNVGTNIVEDGATRRSAKIATAVATLTAKNATSGAALFNRNATGRAIGFTSTRAQDAIQELQNADASSIKSLNREILYALGGRSRTGDSDPLIYGYDRTANTVRFDNTLIRTESETIFNRLAARHRAAVSTGNQNSIDKAADAWREYARGITGNSSFDPTITGVTLRFIG